MKSTGCGSPCLLDHAGVALQEQLMRSVASMSSFGPTLDPHYETGQLFHRGALAISVVMSKLLCAENGYHAEVRVHGDGVILPATEHVVRRALAKAVETANQMDYEVHPVYTAHAVLVPS